MEFCAFLHPGELLLLSICQSLFLVAWSPAVEFCLKYTDGEESVAMSFNVQLLLPFVV